MFLVPFLDAVAVGVRAAELAPRGAVGAVRVLQSGSARLEHDLLWLVMRSYVADIKLLWCNVRSLLF